MKLFYLLSLCSFFGGAASGQTRLSIPDEWIVPSDLAEMRAVNDTQLSVSFVVSPRGEVTKCKAVSFPNQARLHKPACAAVAKRAKFLPAGDRAGQAIEAKDGASFRLWPSQILVSRDFGGATLKRGAIYDEDYPVAAQARREQGYVSFAFNIDTVGLPNSCKIVSSSGSPTLDAATCTLWMSRMRFGPSISPDGTPLVSKARFTMRWRMP